jgi:serine/threonine protein kinase
LKLLLRPQLKILGKNYLRKLESNDDKKIFIALVDMRIGKKIIPFRWREAELLGEGAFGRVILGLNLEKGELMAVKQVGLDDSMEDVRLLYLRVKINKMTILIKKIKSLEQEIELLSQLKHKNIVRYIGTSRQKNKLNIFLEFIKGILID